MAPKILAWFSTDDPNGFSYIWLDELCQSFARIGYYCERVDIRETEAIRQLTDHASTNQYLFALGFQNAGLQLLRYDDLGIPYVNILLDTPYNPNNREIAANVRMQLVLCMDDSDVAYLAACHDHLKFVESMPLAGTRLHEEVLFPDKDIRILFAGTNYNFHQRDWHGKIQPQLAYAVDDAADILLTDDRISIVNAFDLAFRENKLELDAMAKKALYPAMHWIYCFIRSRQRQKLVRTLANVDIGVDVVGEGWENEPFAAQLKIHGRKTYRELLSLIARTRVMVNENGNLRSSVHERVFTGMLNGAVVLTDKSSYFDRHFVLGEDHFEYSWRQVDKVPDLIISLLNREAKIIAVGNAAKSKAMQYHTWDARARHIVRRVQEVFSNSAAK